MAGKKGAMVVTPLAGCCRFSIIHNFANVEGGATVPTPQEYFESFFSKIDTQDGDQSFIFTDSLAEGANGATGKSRGERLAEWIVKQGLGDVHRVDVNAGDVSLFVWEPNIDACYAYQDYLDSWRSNESAKVTSAPAVKGKKAAKPVYSNDDNYNVTHRG